MTWTKKAALAGVAIVLAAGTTIMLVKQSKSSANPPPPWRGAVPTDGQIKQANIGLPDPQIEAKTLVICAMAQKKIPLTANWCEALNIGGRIWPATPTNTVFALNSQVAGLAYSRTMRGDTVAFFETSNPGWNLAGGPELLAKKAEGVAVAFLDGRALIVSPDEVAKLNWKP
jgi:hypothetical protein